MQFSSKNLPNQKMNMGDSNFLEQSYNPLMNNNKATKSQLAQWVNEIKTKCDYEQVVIVGMGGSSLGVRAFSSMLNLNNALFLDELSDHKFNKVFAKVNLSKAVFLVISKSGNTSETLTLFEEILKKLKQNNKTYQNQIFTMTVHKDESQLFKISKELNLSCFEFPKNLSGRYCIFGLPGLLCLELINVDISLIEEAYDECFKDSSILSHLRFLMLESIDKKDFAQNFWSYSGKMDHFRAWLRQLISESLGKKSSKFKDYALPPFVECCGSKDQHSYLQHVLALPDNSLNVIFECASQSKKGVLDKKQLEEAKKLRSYFSKYDIRALRIKVNTSDIKDVSMLFITWMFVTQTVGEHFGLDVFKQENIDELKKISLA